MNIIDLYSGYEGYAELILREKRNNNQIFFEVHLLDFHFNEILSLIPLGQYHEESVMYNFFKAEGWHNSEWECKRIQELYNQLIFIESTIPEKLKEVFNAISQICYSCIQNNSRLFFELE